VLLKGQRADPSPGRVRLRAGAVLRSTRGSIKHQEEETNQGQRGTTPVPAQNLQQHDCENRVRKRPSLGSQRVARSSEEADPID